MHSKKACVFGMRPFAFKLLVENIITIRCVNKKGKEKTVTSDKFIIATGGRPKYPDIPGRVVLACHTNVDGNSWFLGKTFFFDQMVFVLYVY